MRTKWELKNAMVELVTFCIVEDLDDTEKYSPYYVRNFCARLRSLTASCHEPIKFLFTLWTKYVLQRKHEYNMYLTN